MISNPLGSRASAYERVFSRRGALLRSRQAVRHPVQLRRLSGPGCTMSRGSDKQHSSHLPLPPGPLLGTRTHSAGRRSSVARHMGQKKSFTIAIRHNHSNQPTNAPTNAPPSNHHHSATATTQQPPPLSNHPHSATTTTQQSPSLSNHHHSAITITQRAPPPNKHHHSAHLKR